MNHKVLYNTNASGGTELMARRLEQVLGNDLLTNTPVQVVCSRWKQGDLLPDHIRIFYAHDLPNDPASEFLGNPDLANNFHMFVFVSHWQMMQYVGMYNIPWDRCAVIENCLPKYHIGPPSKYDEDLKEINFVYYSTPHRGLDILYNVFTRIKPVLENCEIKGKLNVYSSYEIYDQPGRDEQFKELFDALKADPDVNYSKSISNEDMLKELYKMDVLAYPCTWPETSCLVLIESMASGLYCVHPNITALPETSGGLTDQYVYDADPRKHSLNFEKALLGVVSQIVFNRGFDRDLAKSYSMRKYSFDRYEAKWTNLITDLDNKNLDTSLKVPMFSYTVN